MNSERLLFSHYTTDDFKDYLELVSNVEVMKMVTGHPLSEAEARKRFEKMLAINIKHPEIGHFKISLKSNDNFVGHAKLEMTNEHEAEIGYLLMPTFWNKGYGTEIAERLVQRAINVTKIHNLIAIIDPENNASKRILEKQGFEWNYDGDYFGLAAAYYKLELLREK